MGRRIAVFFVLVLVAAACGDAEVGSEPGTTTPAATSVTTAPPSVTTTTVATTTTAAATIPGPVAVSLLTFDYASQPLNRQHVTDSDGGSPETVDTLLFRDIPGPASRFALLAPDGHQLTRDEWSTAAGTATITCEESGTRYDMEFSGMVPNGVYTIWHFPTSEPLTTRDDSGRVINPIDSDEAIKGGALGSSDGEDNVFTADADGNATLNVLAAPRGLIPECTLVGGTFLIVVYHMDGRSWGDNPGDASTHAWQAIFTYPG